MATVTRCYRCGFGKKLFPKTTAESVRKYLELAYLNKELMCGGVTLKLLWNEYCAECRASIELPLMYLFIVLLSLSEIL